MTLTAANTYTGSTAARAGTLRVTGTGTLTTTALSVNNGAQFSYLPTSAGTLTLGSSATLALANNSTIGLAFGDTIAAPGAATVSGTVNLNISGNFSSGTQYTLLTAASGLATGANYVGFNTTNYTYSLATSATSVMITPTIATALSTEYWIGGLSGAANVWAASNGSTASNWASDASGTATSLTPGATANVIFSATGATNQANMVLGTNMSIGSLTINDPSGINLANTGGYALTIATSGGIAVNSGAGAVTLNSNVVIGTAQTWTNSSGNTLSVGGNVNTAGNLLSIAGTANTTISGSISGSGGLTANSSGVVTLSGANSYTGVTTISSGTLSVASIGNGGTVGSNLGTASNSAANLVFDGGTLQYTGSSGSTDRGFTINAGKTATFDITTNNLTISGASPASNGALTKIGAGTLTLSGNNAYTGNTTIMAGTLALSSATSNNTIANSAKIIVGDSTAHSAARLDVTGVATAGGFQVQSGQTLAGFGTVAGNVTVNDGGTLSPGNNSIGTLTVGSAGNLTLAGNSLSNFELQTVSSYDRVVGVNNIAFGGTLNVTLASGGPTLPPARFTTCSIGPARRP